MTYRGIITGTALTKNTPLEVISLNRSELQGESGKSESDIEKPAN